MTRFFATEDEAAAWVRAETERLGLVVRPAPGATSSLDRLFLWPREAEPAPGDVGVLVALPRTHGDVLTVGTTGWKASAFDETVAATGSRLHRQLVRSIRRIAPVPVHAQGHTGHRSPTPSAWASHAAIASGRRLRQFRDGIVEFVV